MRSSRPRLHPPALAVAAALVAALPGGRVQAQPDGGLRWPGPVPARLAEAGEEGPRWSIRLGLAGADTLEPSLRRGRGLGLMADHDLDGQAGGLRLSGGLLLGDAEAAWRGLRTPGPAGAGRATARSAWPGPDREDLPSAGAGYLGLGYSLASRPAGWGFQADLGLMTRPSGLRLGDAPLRSPSPAELIRELRLNPVLQLGVSYAF